MNRKHLLSVILVLISNSLVMAQDVEMADAMRANGKIYVVAAVAAIVMAVILVYTITIDRRLSQLEKEKRNSKS
jgi:uncharacterized membrane protein YcjF (UPF0283 family)